MFCALTRSDVVSARYLVLRVVTQSYVLSTLAQCCYTKRRVINPRSVLLHKAIWCQPSLSVATESDVLSTLAQCSYGKRCTINPRSVLLHKAMCYQPSLSVATEKDLSSTLSVQCPIFQHPTDRN